jgi:hypothetical protein
LEISSEKPAVPTGKVAVNIEKSAGCTCTTSETLGVEAHTKECERQPFSTAAFNAVCADFHHILSPPPAVSGNLTATDLASASVITTASSTSGDGTVSVW